MTKSMWVAVTILFLLFTACGVFMVLLQKDEEEKNIHYFLTRNRLNTAISYRDLSLSVSDVAVLKDVSVRLNDLPGLTNNIGEFSVHHYKESNHIAARLSFSAEKVDFRLVDIARILKKSDENVIETLAYFNPSADILNYPLYAVLLAGCNTISADVKGDYSYSPAAKKMTLAADISDNCLGRWKISVSLNNISNAQQGQLILAFKHLVQKGSPLTDLKKFLDGAAVTSLSFSYTESALVNGYKRYIDTLYLRQPDTPSPAEPDNRDIQKIVSYLSFSNAHRQRNADIAQTIAAFIKSPDKISFQSKPGKEVPLRVLNGTFLRRVVDLLLRLDTTVTLEKSTF